MISIAIPESYGESKFPELRSPINRINNSIFGSLHNNSDWEVVYNAVNFGTTDTNEIVTDDDILSWSVRSKSDDIVKKAVVQYRFFDSDKTNGESGSKVVSYENVDTARLVGTNQERTFEVYLYNQAEAQTAAERYAFLYSLSQSIVTVKSKLGFARKSLNDKVWLRLDRLYRRYGMDTNQKVMAITAISKSATDISLTLTDWGNLYNRICYITPSDADIFSTASDDEKMVNGYIVDNSKKVPDTTSETEIGTNLIG